MLLNCQDQCQHWWLNRRPALIEWRHWAKKIFLVPISVKKNSSDSIPFALSNGPSPAGPIAIGNEKTKTLSPEFLLESIVSVSPAFIHQTKWISLAWDLQVPSLVSACNESADCCGLSSLLILMEMDHKARNQGPRAKLKMVTIEMQTETEKQGNPHCREKPLKVLSNCQVCFVYWTYWFFVSLSTVQGILTLPASQHVSERRHPASNLCVVMPRARLLLPH